MKDWDIILLQSSGCERIDNSSCLYHRLNKHFDDFFFHTLPFTFVPNKIFIIYSYSVIIFFASVVYIVSDPPLFRCSEYISVISNEFDHLAGVSKQNKSLNKV